MEKKIRALVWNENLHEERTPKIREIYPEGIHGAIAKGLKEDPRIEVTTATLGEPEHGLTEERLASADVLYWWGHCGHKLVEDEIVERVYKHVLEGLGLVVLHSGHFSKIFRRVLASHCSLRWRDCGEKERVWIVKPGHPLVEGLGETFVVPHSEMYGEPFTIPDPEETVMISWYQGGEVFRSGCTWTRGNGKIFYFAPGHETYPIYHQKEVHQVLRNAAHWGAATSRWDGSECRNRSKADAYEPIP